MAGWLKVDEYWWVPVLVQKGRKPIMHERHMRQTRKRMIQDFIDASYSGQHDWAYRRTLGWRAVKVRVFGAFT